MKTRIVTQKGSPQVVHKLSRLREREEYPSDLVFSLDIESSALEEEVHDEKPYLLEFALVPVSFSANRVYRDDALHFYIKAPTIGDMKEEGKISDFVLSNDNLLRVCTLANEKGVSIDEAKDLIAGYIGSFDCMRKDGKFEVIARSPSGLDISLIKKNFTAKFWYKLFYFKILDISSNISLLARCNHPKEKYLDQRKPLHTSKEDAIDAAEDYLKICRLLTTNLTT